MGTGPASGGSRLLAAARGGDEQAFGELVEPHRGELHAHCYRMLGSPFDADDALQDTLLRAWRGLGGFDTDRSLRPWLYRIATNVCLDGLAKRPKRILPVEQGPPAGPDEGPGRPVVELIWLEPYPDEMLAVESALAAPEARYEQRESVELAFVAALQHLPPNQRAVLLMREVLGFSAREVAESLETSVASVNSSMQRARKTVDERLPERSQQQTLRELGDAKLRELVGEYVAAWETRDVDAMVAMLAEDATFAMPPHPHWFRGRDAVITFLASTGEPNLRHVTTRANGQPAIGWYLWSSESELYEPASLEVLALEGDRVREITAFTGRICAETDAGSLPDMFPRFGLPAQLARTS
ncbi:MAG TPA: sigma-70 family RNA polymerase sigma factor [Solirubrobacterales bacterium]|nr:sigma-70 family RNA polymerase sigma factor [Solirubrobacterales bacterium]